MAQMNVREILTQAIRYWEPRRLLFNGVLAVEVLAIFVINFPASRGRLNVDVALFVFVMAVLANVAYCACYVVDVVAQFSDFRAMWLRLRWTLLTVATPKAHRLWWGAFHHTAGAINKYGRAAKITKTNKESNQQLACRAARVG